MHFHNVAIVLLTTSISIVSVDERIYCIQELLGSRFSVTDAIRVL